MGTNEIDIMEDAVPQASDDLLTRIKDHAERMLFLANKMIKGEEYMKKLKEEFDEIQTKSLPDTMDQANMSEFKLGDGTLFKIRDIIKASLPSKGAIDSQKDPDKKEEMQTRLDRGLAWLREHKAESLIKNLITADIGKNNELADAISAFLREKEAVFKREETVNANTLTSYIKEQIAGGTEIDFELFGVFSGRQVKVTRAKK